MSAALRDEFLEHPDRPLRLAAAVVAAFALVAAAFSISGYKSVADNALSDAQLKARGAAADVERYIQSQWWTLEAVALAPPVRTGDAATMKPYIDTIDPASLGLDAGLSFIDTHGISVARAGYSGPPVDLSQRPHIQKALATRSPVVSDAFVGTVNQAPVIAFDVPVFDTSGAFIGLIGSGIRLDKLSIGADTLRYAGGTNVIIVDGSGNLLSSPDGIDAITPTASAFPLAQTRGAEGALVAPAGPIGESGSQIVGYATAPTSGWTVLVQTPAEAILGPARGALAIQLGIILGLAALGIGLMLWAAERLRRASASERRTLVELQAAVATLERRQRLSDAFVGVMSHELRTPVTTIYGGVKLLRRAANGSSAGLDARTAEILPDIEEEAERLQRITEDLLVLSRAEHGAVEIRPEPILLQRIIPMAVADVARRFPDVRIQSSVPSDLPAAAADDGAVRQVLGNLLSNAAKYGGGEPIGVAACQVDDLLEIDVTDAGPGVDAGEHDRLFELFYRSPTNRRSASGTGIGLFVVRELVAAMGGSVAARPAQPHGMRFTVRLPVYELDGAVAGAGGAAVPNDAAVARETVAAR